MATVTGLTAERMQEIIDSTIVDADIVDNHLILTKDDGSTFDAGALPAPEGGGGIEKVTDFPVTAEDGDMIVHIGQVGDPTYKYVDGAWELQPRMGALTVSSCKLTHSANQAVGAGATVFLTWDTERYDRDTMHDGANPTRITFKTPGIYRVFLNMSLTATYTGSDEAPVAIRLNGDNAQILAYTSIQQGNGTFAPLSFDHEFKAGDYIEARVTGGNQALTIVGNTLFSPNFGATWLGGAGQTIDERGAAAVKAVKTVAQSIPNATITAITFPQADEYDTDGMHDPATNSSRITIKTPGLYEFTVDASWGTGTTGRRQLHFLKNGATVIRSVQDQAQNEAAAWHGNVLVAHALLAAGDYVEVMAFHTQGAALNIDGATFDATLVATGKTVTPYARLEKTTAQSIPNDTGTAVSWDVAGERADSDLIWDSAQPTRLTCRTAGVYLITAGANWPTNSTGSRLIVLRKSGTDFAAQRVMAITEAAKGTLNEVSGLIELAVGDYVEVFVTQGSGGALNLNATGTSFVAGVKIGAPIVGNTGIEVIEGWHPVGGAGEPAFANSWVNYDPGEIARFRKDRGVVYIDGMIKSGTIGQTVFVLPAGYRPNQIVRIPLLTSSNDFGGNITVAELRIQTDGAVKVMGGSNVAAHIHGNFAI